MSDESLSDLFDDSDNFIPPTSSSSSESDDICTTTLKRKKRKGKLCKKRLLFDNQRTDEIVISHINDIEADHNDLEVRAEIATAEKPNMCRDQIENTPKKNVRKRISNPAKWKTNIRKKAHQAGNQYVNQKGKTVSEKVVKTTKNCINNCKYKCSSKISQDERQDIHASFYSLQNFTEKRHFIINTSSRLLTARPKITNPDHSSGTSDDDRDESTCNINKIENRSSRRKYSFKYYFNVNDEQIQVCKRFYLGTLDISQKPVYTAHSTKNVKTNTPVEDKRGKNLNSRRQPDGNPDFCREHIKSFPCVESHYCRANTKRSYLGAHLSISKMYELYREKCLESNVAPVKKSMYYRIFGTEFNLGFHMPKSDRCDLCETYKVAEQSQTLTGQLEKDYEKHILLKNLMREARKKEKNNPESPVLLFDLQNVILTPHADISSMFYLRKLSNYNLTAYYSVTKKVYCALWPETLAGRTGNDIASAFRKILEVVVDENEITELTTWSDSCVPQNRNSIIANSVLDFLKEHPNMTKVTMKYSVPGHGCVQEVDNSHSQIEKAMNKTDFFSPIGLIRILKSINKQNPYKVIQMRADDFKDFSSTSKLLNYKAVPFSQVAVMQFTRQFSTIMYKVTHDDYEPTNAANVRFLQTPSRLKHHQGSTGKHSSSICSVFDVKPNIQKRFIEISELKKKDIKSAFPFMPVQDRDYYKAVLHL